MSDQVESRHRHRRRRRARRIIELMRGDVIRILADSQLNNKIYFIDYIDETKLHLIPDMRNVSDPNAKLELELELENGRFPLHIQSIELLYRNKKEQGYARQRGLIVGKWIEIEYITPEDNLKVIIYGEIVSLTDDTDCIGVSIYNPSNSDLSDVQRQVVYIDFEFKGLSPDLNIRSIKVCNKPLSLLREREYEKEKQAELERNLDRAASEGPESESESEESQEFEESSALKNVNLEFQKSPPGPDDNQLAQNRNVNAGDKIAITFEPIHESDAPTSIIFIREEFRYYSLEEQQQGLLEALIENAPTSKSHHLSTIKDVARMIDRYTQLRDTYSLKTKDGVLLQTPYYGNDYKPLIHALLYPALKTNGLDYNSTNDWLVPIYVQRRKIYCTVPEERPLFETYANVYDVPGRLIEEQTQYEDYMSKKSGTGFYAYLDKVRLNTIPYDVEGDGTSYTLSKYKAFEYIATCASDVRSLVVPAYNQSKTWTTCLYTSRYIEYDSFPEYPTGYMVRPYPFVAFSALKSRVSSIMDKTNIRLANESCNAVGVSAQYRWSLTNNLNSSTKCASLFKTHDLDRINSRDTDVDTDVIRMHERFANRMKTEIYFSKSFDMKVMYRFVPSTEELALKAMNYFKYYHGSLSPSKLIASLSPFFIQPEHVTHDLFLHFSRFIHEYINMYKLTIKHMKRIYSSYESLTFPGFGTGAGPSVNAIYALVTHPDISVTESTKKKNKKNGPDLESAFDTTVVSKYPIKEWMVKGSTSHERIFSNSEILSRMYMVDFGRSLMNEVVRLNMSSDNLYGVNVGGVIDHFVSEAEKLTGVVNAVKDAAEVKHANKPPKEGKFILAKKYETMAELNADNEASPHVPIAYDTAFDSTDYGFIQRYEKERRNKPADVFKAFLIDKLHHSLEVKKKQKITIIECEHEVNAMISGRRVVRPGSKERAVVVFTVPEAPIGESTGEDAVLNMDAYDGKPDAESEAALSKEYRYYKLAPNGTWILDDTIPPTITPENTEFFGNIFPGAIVMKNNCLSTETGITPESGEVVTSLAKASLISKITHEFDGIIESKYEDFKKIFDERVNYYDYRLQSEIIIERRKQFDVNNKHYKIGERAKRSESSKITLDIAVSPSRDILNAYLGNGSFPRMQELIISFAKNYTRRASRPCAGSHFIEEKEKEHVTGAKKNEPEQAEFGDAYESCEWLYCKDTGAKLMPVWLLDKANAYVNDGHGELSYLRVMDKICREYGVIEGAFWVDGKKCKSGMVIMPVAFSTYEGYDEQGFKIKTNAVVSMEADEYILLGVSGQKSREGFDEASRMQEQEQVYIRHINTKFKNVYAHKINDVVTPIIKTGLGISPDRDGLRDKIITSVIKTITGVKVFKSKSQYEAENAKTAKKQPSYESYCDRVIVMTTLAHIIIIIQSAVPEIRPAKTFRNCKTTFRGYPIDINGDNACLEYIACIASEVKDSSKDVWVPVLSVKPKIYVEDVKKAIDFILKPESDSDSYFHKMLEDKRRYIESELLRQNEARQLRDSAKIVKKWTQFLPLLDSLKDVSTPEPVPEAMFSTFVNDVKSGSKHQHERIDLFACKIMQYSFYIQKMIQDWLRSNGSATSLFMFSSDHRPVTENACCDDMIMVKPWDEASKSKYSPNVLEYFISKANVNIREFNGQIKRLSDVLVDVSNTSKTYILSHNGLISITSKTKTKSMIEWEGDPFRYALHAYSDETIIRCFIHFFKLDYSNPYIEPRLMELKKEVNIPDNYDPKWDMSEKFVKIKAAKSSSGSSINDQFENVLNEVNRSSQLPRPSTLTQTQNDVYYDMKNVLDELKSADADADVNTGLFTGDIIKGLLYLIDIKQDDPAVTATQDTVNEWLSQQCKSLKDKILSILPSPQSRKKGEKGTGLKDFVELFGQYGIDSDASFQSVDKQMLHHYFDAETPMHYMTFVEKFITFIKNATRFMLQTVPGLLITSELTVYCEKEKEDKSDYVGFKHWKFSNSHNSQISSSINAQYEGLTAFKDDATIQTYMKQIDAAGNYEKTMGYMINQLMGCIPLVSEKGRTVLNVDFVKKMYTYLFYKTVELYMPNDTEVGNVRRVQRKTKEFELQSRTLQNMDSGMINDDEYEEQTAPRLGRRMRELLLPVMEIIMKMQNNNSISLSKMRTIMAKVRRKETEDMRYSFYESSRNTKTDAFQIRKTMLKLRIGEYSVGAQVANRKYDRDFDERERDAVNRRIAEGGSDPNVGVEVEAFEDEIRVQNESNIIVDGQQSIAPMDGDEYEREQLMRNEVDIISAC